MSVLTYKCPSCGAPLTYDGSKQELTCGSCGNSFTPDVVREVAEIESQDTGFERMEWDMQDGPFSEAEAAHTRAYSCSSCGSQLMTDETTVATNCAFCGSPAILEVQFTEETRPQVIVPFLISKEKATQMFKDYFKGKRLLPNLFLKNNHIDEIRQLYVPYWMFSCQADARLTYNATQVSSHRSGNYEVTRTRHFLVRRAGTLNFAELPVDASSKMDNNITESIEPYNMGDGIPFSPETLSGALANRADQTPEQCVERANQRVRNTTENVFRSTVQGYTTVVPRSTSIRIKDGSSVPVLLPVWVITTVKNKKTYTFAINGQTGELTTDIPYSKAKFHMWLWGVTGMIGGGASIAAYVLARLGVLK